MIGGLLRAVIFLPHTCVVGVGRLFGGSGEPQGWRPLFAGGGGDGGASGGVLPVMNLATFDESYPQEFYLTGDGLEELSDCFAVVGGTRLPLHSQVLGAQSAVLRDLFRSQKEGGAYAQVRVGQFGTIRGSLLAGCAELADGHSSI